ncbi:MAG: hypothetical protein QXF56_01850 [Candidatus Micrarchaeia archaeon]
MAEFKKIVRENAGYLVIAALLILYVLTHLSVVAVLCALAIVGFFVYETVEGARKRGWKKELEEIVVAVLVGVLIWFGAGFILNTSSPLDAVVSCSMLPHLERGDMVVLRGSEVKAPSIELTSSEWEEVKGRMHTTFTCGPCVKQGDYTPYNFSLCRSCGNSCLIAIDGKPVFSEQNDTLFSYNYGLCTLKGKEEVLNSVCVRSVTIKGEEFEENFGNDVIVYEPEQNSVFQSLTIHRVLVRVSVERKEYYLTKGDNNEILDVQAPGYVVKSGNECRFFSDSRKENKPVEKGRIHGSVIARIPYLGYLKLFLWGYVEVPQGCGTVIEKHNA